MEEEPAKKSGEEGADENTELGIVEDLREIYIFAECEVCDEE